MKTFIKRFLHILLTPWRRERRKRDGVQEYMEFHTTVPNEILLTLVSQKIAEGHDATINVRGYSMRPFLEHERDKVILTGIHKPLQVGDAVLAELRKGLFVLHRIIDIQGDSVTLMGDGNVRGTEQCRLEDVRGLVTHYIRPNRTLLASDEKLQRSIRRWRKLLPIRRYLLLIYKATL